MIVLLTLLLSQTAFAAGGSWMFTRDTETAAAPEAVTPAPTVRAPSAKKEIKKKDKKSEVSAADASGIPDGCSNDFTKAAAYFKAAHNVELARIGEFSGGFKDFTSTNRFKTSGRSLILSISIGGMVNADVPVKVCKAGKRLTATLITSNAREAGTAQPQAMISEMVKKGEAPRAITLNVTRNGNNLNFAGRSGSTAVTAAAAVR